MPPIPSPRRSRPRRARRRERAGAKRLVIVRPPWRPLPGDRWIDVDTVEEAAAAIPAEAQRVFLTVGVRSLAPFAGRPDLWFLVRLVDEPAEPIPLARHQLICARGPFTEDDERALLEAHGIDCLVTRASGGDATVAKLAAARALGLPVVMVRRPPPPPGTVRVLDRGCPRLDRAAAGSVTGGAWLTPCGAGAARGDASGRRGGSRRSRMRRAPGRRGSTPSASAPRPSPCP